MRARSLFHRKNSLLSLCQSSTSLSQVFDLHDCYDTIKSKAQKAQSAARAQALAVSGSPEAAHAALQVVGESESLLCGWPTSDWVI